MEKTKNQLWGKVLAEIQIDLNEMVVTYKTATRVLLSVIEFLSYNRNQIPLVFETFNLMASKMEKAAPTDQASNAIKDFAMGRQKELVIKTNQSFRDLTDVNIIISTVPTAGRRVTTNFIFISRLWRRHLNITKLKVESFVLAQLYSP